MGLSSYSASGTLDDHGLVLDDRGAFAGGLRSMKRGRVIVTVEVDRGKRSNQYNRYYRGHVLTLIADHTGDDPDSLHDYFKRRFNPIVVMGVEVGGSTANMDSDQFDAFVRNVRHFALHELNVVTDDPDPAWRSRRVA